MKHLTPQQVSKLDGCHSIIGVFLDDIQNVFKFSTYLCSEKNRLVPRPTTGWYEQACASKAHGKWMKITKN